MGRRVGVITSPRSGGAAGPPSPPRGGTPAPAAPPPTLPPVEPQKTRHRRWGWPRILLGAALVLLCATGGSAVAVLEQVHSLRDALKQNSSLKIGRGVLTKVGWGQPETLLLVGDDHRALTKYYHVAVGHLANEMLLVRLDPSKPYISMMSIPRELMATIYPPRGRGLPFPNRLNFAYHYGIGSLVTSIQRDLPGLSINHVIVATFGSFKRAVNEMGCVYSTVDRRYYHVNVPGGDQYQQINLQPGYQRMCGEQALEFVSYRHDDTSLVRDARDQSFLMDVKKQYGPTLFDNVGKFEHIFGQAVRTDGGLQSTTGLLNLLGTLINLSGRHVRQVHFRVTLQPTGANPCSCDTATPQQIRTSVNDFLHGHSQIPSTQSIAAQAHPVHKKHAAARLPLVPTPSSALGRARAEAAKLSLVLEYPRVEDRGGSWQSPSLRAYKIAGPDKTAYPAYVAVFYDGGLGQYYDVQGMSWTTAPQFDSPDRTIHVGARTYYLYFESSNLRMIAWYEHDAVYWIRNTLTDSVPIGEMLRIAEQTEPFTVAGSGRNQAPVILRAARVPLPTTAKPRIPLKLMIGGLAALVTLVGLPLLMLLGIRRFLDLRRARVMLASGQAVGERLPLVPTLASPPRPSPVPLLAPSVAFGDAGAPVLSQPAFSVHWVGRPTVYRRWSIRQPAVIVSMLVVLALAGGGAAAAVLITRHNGQPRTVHRVKHVARPLIPTVPVVVLNATTVPGAAHKLALSLQADRIKVTGIGNLLETLPPGNEILYASGQRAQAQRLARLLGHQVATIAPIDPAIAGAAGSGARLVVVITGAEPVT